MTHTEKQPYARTWRPVANKHGTRLTKTMSEAEISHGKLAEF